MFALYNKNRYGLLSLNSIYETKEYLLKAARGTGNSAKGYRPRRNWFDHGLCHGIWILLATVYTQIAKSYWATTYSEIIYLLSAIKLMETLIKYNNNIFDLGLTWDVTYLSHVNSKNVLKLWNQFRSKQYDDQVIKHYK